MHMLGICFGGQLLASTLGGAVVPSADPEIGWIHVASDDETIVPSARWFQWHYDRWGLHLQVALWGRRQPLPRPRRRPGGGVPKVASYGFVIAVEESYDRSSFDR